MVNGRCFDGSYVPTFRNDDKLHNGWALACYGKSALHVLVIWYWRCMNKRLRKKTHKGWSNCYVEYVWESCRARFSAIARRSYLEEAVYFIDVKVEATLASCLFAVLSHNMPIICPRDSPQSFSPQLQWQPIILHNDATYINQTMSWVLLVLLLLWYIINIVKCWSDLATSKRKHY